MENFIQYTIDTILRNPPISTQIFEKEIKSFDFELPFQYLEFMKIANGGIISNDYARLVLWPIEKILYYNEGYQIEKYAKGYLALGTNGGGTAFSINKKTKEFVQFEFIGMLMDDELIFLGKNFNEFLKNLLSDNAI